MGHIEHWRDTNNILAKLVDKRDIRGYATKDLILDPGEAAVLIVDGRIEDTLTQTRLKKVGGGWKGWMGRKLNVGKDIKLLLVDAKPFTLKLPVRSHTSDHIEANGKATVELQFDLNVAHKIVGMIRERPVYVTKGIIRKRQEVSDYVMLLTKEQLQERLGTEIAAKVFATVMGTYSAGQIREAATQGRLDTAAQVEMRKTLGLWGLTLQNIFVNWDLTVFDRFKAEQATSDMTQSHKLEQAARVTQAEREQRWKDQQMRLEIEKREDAQDASQLADLIKLKGQMKEQKIKEFQETELAKTRVEAERDVEVSKHSLEGYKEAQATERGHSLNMMGEMAKIFSGQQGASVPQSQHGETTSADQQTEGAKCSHCGAAVDPKWKACPECGWVKS